MKSIIQETKTCYCCGTMQNLELHHCCHGTANRKIADRLGLTVYLCHRCHSIVHDSDRSLDLKLIQTAQRKYEETHTREEWRSLFGKSWL